MSGVYFPACLETLRKPIKHRWSNIKSINQSLLQSRYSPFLIFPASSEAVTSYSSPTSAHNIPCTTSTAVFFLLSLSSYNRVTSTFDNFFPRLFKCYCVTRSIVIKHSSNASYQNKPDTHTLKDLWAETFQRPAFQRKNQLLSSFLDPGPILILNQY